MYLTVKFDSLCESFGFNGFREMQERKVPVIVITVSVLNPLAPFADVCLEVKETEVFGFRGLVLSALMCLSPSLIVELGKQLEH